MCDKPAKCVNCSGNHPANSKQCPQWEKEKQILKIECENNISFPDARKQYEQFYTDKTYASAVKPGTCNKTTQIEDKNTQTKTKTRDKPQDKKQGKENSSHPGPALKQAIFDMMRKDEETKRKEEKDKLKQQQKEERRHLILKQQAQKEKRRSTKSKTS